MYILYATIIICTVISLVIFAIVFARTIAKNRSKHIKELARRLGFVFSHNSNNRLFEIIKYLPIFKQGYSRTISNIMEKQDSEVCISVFDYGHETLSMGDWYPKMRSVQTMMLFELKEGKFPVVEIHTGKGIPNLAPEILAYLKEHPMLDIESRENTLLVYESNIRHPSDDLEIVIKEGIKVYELFNKSL